jgi:hypothetical protein
MRACRRQRETGNACNRQRATSSRRHGMQEDASTCEMQQETHGTAAFRVRRAAGSGEPAACAKHCARSIVRDNQCATRHRRHTRCNARRYDPCRSMQQTQTEPTTRSRQCNVRDETNEIWTLAHLGARCAGVGGVGWSVGLGLPESDVTVESCNSQNWAFGYGGTDCAREIVQKRCSNTPRGDSRALSHPPGPSGPRPPPLVLALALSRPVGRPLPRAPCRRGTRRGREKAASSESPARRAAQGHCGGKGALPVTASQVAWALSDDAAHCLFAVPSRDRAFWGD